MNFISMISEDGFVHAMAIDGREICEEARKIHDSFPVATAALGRSLMAASLLGGMLKVDGGSLTLRIKGDGPLEGITCVSDEHGNVRGYCGNPQIELPLNGNGKLDVATAVGREGYVSVVKDLRMKEPYVGQTPIVSGEIAEDVANYLFQSEQTASALALGVLVDRDYSVKVAGGYLIRPMPGCPEDVMRMLEGALYTADPVTEMLGEGMSAETMLKLLLPGFKLSVIDREERKYFCTCSRERTEKALISLGRVELEKISSEQKETEILCEFCKKAYLFTDDDIKSLLF